MYVSREPYCIGMLFVVVVAAVLAPVTESVKGRPYKSVDDFANVKGIGNSKMEKIKPHDMHPCQSI